MYTKRYMYVDSYVHDHYFCLRLVKIAPKTFYKGSEPIQVGFEPFSRPMLLPLSYQGCGVDVDQIRQYNARQSFPIPPD